MTETDLITKALSIPDQVNGITITNPETYQKMADVFLVIRGLRKEINETFDHLISDAFKHHRALVAEKKRHDTPLDEGERKAKSLMQAHDAEQARIARDEELRLQAIARKAEEERKLAEALAAEAEGDHEAAAEIIEEEVYVPPVTVQKAVPKVSGVVFRTYWKFRVNDLRKLVKAVAEGKAPVQCLKSDDVFLGAQATAMKTHGEIYPGVEAYSERK